MAIFKIKCRGSEQGVKDARVYRKSEITKSETVLWIGLGWITKPAPAHQQAVQIVLLNMLQLQTPKTQGSLRLPHSTLALGELGQRQIALCTHNFTHFSASQIDDCRVSMSTEELARNASFRQEAHRDRDAVCLGLLRQYLEQLLGTPADHIQLIKNENGKPMLADTSNQLHFNYSHSGDYVALAFCRDTSVGVDIEFAKRRTNLMGVARHFFAPAELAALESLPVELQRDRFFRYWTLKEAYLKARGEGIFLGLDKFSFELDAEDAQRVGISFSSEDFDNPAGWQFHQLMPVLDYPVAIALCDRARTFNVELYQ